MLDLYTTFDSDELESAKRFYPRWTGRRDKVSVNSSMSIQYDVHTQHGIPVYVFRLASLTGPLLKELNAVPEGRRYQRMCVSLITNHHRLVPIQLVLSASPSGSSCPALPFPSVPPSPTHPLSRRLRPRVYLPLL